MHSQRLNEPPVQPWVILRSSGEVESAHCTCMAGIAESCTHVAAMLFKVDYVVKARGRKTVTDVPAYWMMPRSINKVYPEEAYKIDFSSAAAQRKKLEKQISGEEVGGIHTRRGCSKPCDHPTTTLDDLAPLLEVLQVHSKAVCLSGMKTYFHQYKDPVQPRILPKSLQHLRDPGTDGFVYPRLQQHCKELMHLTAISDTQAAVVEAKTRRQHRSPAWYTMRAGRITASNIHAVVSTSISKPAMSTVRSVCYPKKTATTPATRWGIIHEVEARQAYVSLAAPHHENLKVEQCGFILNPAFPEVGASPDGLVHCICCGNGCLEVKCPFKHQNTSISEACTTDKHFCLQITDGKVTLKNTHRYFYQVQTHIFVTGSEFCDFVVWTLKDCVVVRVFPDEDFWRAVLPKAQELFASVSLPEIVAHYYTGLVSSQAGPSTALSQASCVQPPKLRPRKRARH
ncbi:uncharacterized protein PAE49_018376 [Odontesthes bonariensis]